MSYLNMEQLKRGKIPDNFRGQDVTRMKSNIDLASDMSYFTPNTRFPSKTVSFGLLSNPD